MPHATRGGPLLLLLLHNFTLSTTSYTAVPSSAPSSNSVRFAYVCLCLCVCACIFHILHTFSWLFFSSAAFAFCLTWLVVMLVMECQSIVPAIQPPPQVKGYPPSCYCMHKFFFFLGKQCAWKFLKQTRALRVGQLNQSVTRTTSCPSPSTSHAPFVLESNAIGIKSCMEGAKGGQGVG